MDEMNYRDYLGDSVYAEFDGFNIYLTTNNGYPDDPRNVIALEPEVYAALIRFAGRLPAQAGFKIFSRKLS